MTKTYIFDTWNEFNEDSDRSIKSDFCDSPYANKDKIIEYLSNGHLTGIKLGSYKDLFTGEDIGPGKSFSDDDFIWNSSLPYYIKMYNLRLPSDIENKILKKAESL